MITYGILVNDQLRTKPRRLLYTVNRAFQSLGLPSRQFSHYKPCETLILYGWGGHIQQQAIEKHPGNYVAFDLGYWEREGFVERKWRVSINGFHPPELIMQGGHPRGRRFADSGLSIEHSKERAPRILLVGSGPKSQRVGAKNWSMQKSIELRRQFPGVEIWYKPKPERPPEPHVDFDMMVEGKIDAVLEQVSLVVCRHSNVAVDACLMGVPVVCDDGAAAAIYPSKLKDYMIQPDFHTRKKFLERLAWWQWSIREISTEREFIRWLQGQLDGVQRTVPTCTD